MKKLDGAMTNKEMASSRSMKKSVTKSPGKKATEKVMKKKSKKIGNMDSKLKNPENAQWVWKRFGA